MNSRVVVNTGSRVHFGLGPIAPGRFCGLGAMVDRPGFNIEVTTSSRWQLLASDDQRPRIRNWVDTWCRQWGDVLPSQPACADELHCRLHVTREVRPHCGWGSGTQLALAIAAALFRYWRGRDPVPHDNWLPVLARGERALVGSAGFFHGGLNWDPGSIGEEGPAMLSRVRRQTLPSTWSVLLLSPKYGVGVSGPEEHARFAKLHSPHNLIVNMERLVEDEILVAAESVDFDRFASALYQFSRLAGECFAPVQGGIYNGEWVAHIIEQLRAWHVIGVGQSSWGPGVYAWFEQADLAREIAQRVHARFGDDVETAIAGPLNQAATVEEYQAQEQFQELKTRARSN